MTPLMAAGVELMLVGMGTVFFFLTLLVIVTGLMSRLATHLSPPALSLTSQAPLQDEEVAAISAAIALHRKHNG